MTRSPIIVFADGACSGNPGPGGWGAIIVTPEGHVTELGGGKNPTTNNQMELMAAIRALMRLQDVPGEVDLYTDSVYVIRGITQWIWGWRKNGWKSKEGGDVANQDLWKQLGTLVAGRGKASPIHWRYVKGHSGVPGNERVDEIAVAFTRGQYAKLFDGSLLSYNIPIHDIPENTDLPEMKERPAKAPAYSYLSLVNGTPMRHTSWRECEARVKGRSGAKFKKAMSPIEEAEILKSWGFAPEKI